MAITVLLPEFIFSKAICELRLALSDLSEFEMMIRADYKDGFKGGYSYDNEEVVQFWKWHAEYSRVVLFLYRLMGLPQPPVPAVEEDGIVETTYVGDGEQRSGKRNTSSDDEDIRGMEKNAQENAAREAAQTDSCAGHPDGSGSDGDAEMESARDRDSGKALMLRKLRRIELAKEHAQSQKKFHTYSIPQHWTLAHAFLTNMGGLLYANWPQERCLAKDTEYYVLTGAKLSRRYYWSYNPTHPLQGLILS